MGNISAEIWNLYQELDYNDNKDNTSLTDIISSLNIPNRLDCNDPNILDEYQKLIQEIKATIERNLSSFQRHCCHVDVVDTILKYLSTYSDYMTYFPSMFAYSLRNEDSSHINYHKYKLILKAALYLKCGESWLEDLFPKSVHMKIDVNTHINSTLVIFEDADLYAVIDALKTNERKTIPWKLENIWVQEPIKSSFAALVKESFDSDDIFNISTFRINDEVVDKLKAKQSKEKPYAISMWSENIAHLKNLAMTLRVTFIFLNSYGDFSGRIVLSDVELGVKFAPPTGFLHQTEGEWYTKHNEKHHIFYGGTWQFYSMLDKQVDSNVLIRDHLVACMKWAERGFKVWSALPMKRRMEIICNFADRLLHVGDKELAEKIILWAKVSFKALRNINDIDDDGIETLITRKPVGIVVVVAQTKEFLFSCLIPALMFGDAVIIFASATIPNITQYCDMFNSCGFPAGVINSLAMCDIEYALILNTAQNAIKTQLVILDSVFDESEVTTSDTFTKVKKDAEELFQNWFEKCTLPFYIISPLK